MDYKEALMLSKYPEYFPPEEPIRPLEAMEQARQAHLAQELFDRLVGERKYEQAKKVAWYMWFNHGIWQFDN